MPDVTLRNAVDTWANADRASVNYADSRTISVRSSDRHGFIFINRPAPLTAIYSRAILRLTYAANVSAAHTLSVRSLSESWKQSRTTWNNRPGVTADAAIAVSCPAGPAGTVIEVDITPIMQRVSGGQRWYGLRLTTTATAQVSFGSAQGTSSYRPELDAAWAEYPDAPSTLTPNGNKAVATDKPTLDFDYTDDEGDTALAAVQIQLDAAADFTAPDFDSGWVDTTSSELPLSTTAYAGLANLASTYWRVRVRNAAGLESVWSDDEQFRRVDRGTVTITNPPAATSVVFEPTPPILWTFNATQKQWQVLIVDPASPSTVFADSTKRTSTEKSWTPPAGTLTGVGPYRVIVRVWDDVDRQGVPEATAYASTSRDFTVSVDAAVTPVSGLTVTQPHVAKPRVELSWERATAADAYVVSRDDVVVAELPPEDVLVSGTSYLYVDDTARAWHEHTWQVRAVEDTKQSESTTVTLTPRQRGIWLLDKQRKLEVWLAGDDGGSWSRGEEASVFAPVGRKSVVRRVQQQRGFEGSLSGTLVDRHGVTAREYEDALLKMRDEPTSVVVLAVADMSISVILGNVTTYPTSSTPPVRLASFDFWEVDT